MSQSLVAILLCSNYEELVAGGGDMERTAHPDSVSLVHPPNTTIPNTLAALPRSQYATIFSVTSGNRGSLLEPLPILRLRLARGEELMLSVALADDKTVDLVLKARANLAWKGCVHPFDRGFSLVGSFFCRHWRHVKNSRESRGALTLKVAKTWDAGVILKESIRARTIGLAWIAQNLISTLVVPFPRDVKQVSSNRSFNDLSESAPASETHGPYPALALGCGSTFLRCAMTSKVTSTFHMLQPSPPIFNHLGEPDFTCIL